MGVPRSRLTRQSFRPDKGRRLTEWAATGETGPTTIASAGKVIVFSFTAAALVQIVPSTLIRIRGYLYSISDQVAAAENYSGAVGITIVKEEARAAGVASIPGPFNQGSADIWLWHQYLQGGVGTTVDGSGVTQSFEIDGKAMRKVVDGEAIVGILELGSATGLILGWQIRLLFLLS